MRKGADPEGAMSQENERPRANDIPPTTNLAGPQNAPSDHSPSDSNLRAECARLSEEVCRLKQERDEYRSMLYAWVKDYFLHNGPQPTPEELRRLIDEAAAAPPDDFLADFLTELEQSAKGQ
jgi:hypothetical protein